MEDLIAAGVEFVQFDEPVLTELVFTQKMQTEPLCAGH